MATFTISDADLVPLKDKVVLVTGGSSGIGLATVRLLLSLGAKVVMGDRNPPPQDLVASSPDLSYAQVDITEWKSVLALFKKAIELHGRLDHVFANAGISTTENYLEQDLDENGDLLPPTGQTMNVNLLGTINTVKLAIYYLRKNTSDSSIVITASASSFHRFEAVDYATSKHAVLGLMRGLVPLLHPKLPIRVNALAPMWTETGIVPRQIIEQLGFVVQSPDVVARSTAIAMADQTRHGQLLYSDGGVFKEIEETLLCASKGFSEWSDLSVRSAVDQLHEAGAAGKGTQE